MQEANIQAPEFKIEERTAKLGESVFDTWRWKSKKGHWPSSNLRVSYRRLKALRDIDVAISSSLDPRISLGVVVSRVVDELQVSAADILVLNWMTQTFEYAAGEGFRTHALRHTNIRLGEGYAGKAARTRQRLCIDDLDRDNGGFGRSPVFDQEGFHSYCAIPLVSKGQVQVFWNSSIVDPWIAARTGWSSLKHWPVKRSSP